MTRRADRQRWSLVTAGLVALVFLGLATLGLVPEVSGLAGLAAAVFSLVASGGLAAAYLASGAGLGLLVTWPLRRGRLGQGSGPRPVLQACIGCAAQLWLAHLAGWLGLFSLGPVAAIGLLVPGWAALAWRVIVLVREKQRAAALHPLWMLAAAPLAVALLAAASPPGWLWGSEFGGFDALSYHLPVAIEWAAAGKVSPLLHNVYSFLPSYVEAAYTQLHVALGGGQPAAGVDGLRDGLFAFEGAGLVACQYLSVGYLILAAAATAAVVTSLARDGVARTNGSGSETVGRIAGVVAGAAVLCVPWSVVVGSLAYNETAVMMCLAAAMLAAVDGGLSTRARGLLCGVLVGAACGGKPTALFVVAPVVALLLAVRVRRREWRKLAVWGVIAATVAFVPPLVRNAIASHGNPVFPAATGLFGLGHWTAEQAAVFAASHHESAPLLERLGMLLGTVSGGDGQPRGVLHRQFSILWPLAAVCAVLAMRRRALRGVVLALLGGLAAAMVWWLFYSHCQSRFLVPLTPVCGMLVGLGMLGLAAKLVSNVTMPPVPTYTEHADGGSDETLWQVPPLARVVGLVVLAGTGLMGVLCVTLFLSERTQEIAPGHSVGMPNAWLLRGVSGITGASEQSELRAIDAGLPTEAPPETADRFAASIDPDTRREELIASLSVSQYVNLMVPDGQKVYLLGDSTPLYMPGKLARGELVYHVTWERSPLGELIRTLGDDPEAWTRELRAQNVRWVMLNLSELARLQASGYYDKAITPERVRGWLELWADPVHGGQGSSQVLFKLRAPPATPAKTPGVGQAFIDAAAAGERL